MKFETPVFENIRRKGRRRESTRTWCKVILHRSTFILGCALALTAGAQQYPSRPVRVIAPYPPGSSADVMGRIYARSLTEMFGKQFIVDKWKNVVEAAGLKAE